MKNNKLLDFFYPIKNQCNQIFRIMRITTFLLLVCVFCAFAENSHSQNAQVTINKENVTLEDILSEIEEQTDYLFVYNNEINVNRKVSVKAEKKNLTVVLSELLAGT